MFYYFWFGCRSTSLQRHKTTEPPLPPALPYSPVPFSPALPHTLPQTPSPPLSPEQHLSPTSPSSIQTTYQWASTSKPHKPNYYGHRADVQVHDALRRLVDYHVCNHSKPLSLHTLSYSGTGRGCDG